MATTERDLYEILGVPRDASDADIKRSFRRLARDYERLPETLAGLHFLAFACLFLHRVIPLLDRVPFPGGC